MRQTINGIPARTAAYRSLRRIDAEGRYSNLELDSAIGKYRLEGAEKRLYTALLYGVIERRLTLDFLLSTLLKGETAPEAMTLLRLSLWQLLYADRIPDSAAVNEGVELAKSEGMKGLAPMINGVLRAAVRARDDAGGGAAWLERAIADAGLTEDAALSVRASACEGLCRLLREGYGAEKAAAVLMAAREPYIAVQTNTLRLTREELAAKLGDCEASPLTARGLRFTGDAAALRSAIEEGLCFVQDEASQLTALAVGAVPGDDVLDVCAAPGGKSFAVALDLCNTGSLLSCDLHANKLRLVEKGAARLGATVLRTMERDASAVGGLPRGGFDRVLCDVPCSGSGVIAKKPELRYRDPSDYARLPDVQTAILAASSELVKPGGTLVYSTCTLNPAENGGVTAPFLASHGSFRSLRERTFFPDTDGCDGFYLCVMRRSDD